jgi:serine/threonine protein phosphatase PrpC
MSIFRAADITLSGAWHSHPGQVRQNNEDLPIFQPHLGLYGVIDGMGGQAAGEIAAAIAQEVIVERFARPLGTPAERVREAIALANNEIAKQAEIAPERHGMACVVTVGVVAGRTVTLGHVGDSRAYKISPAAMIKLTHDHSPVGVREDARELTELDAMEHPRRNEVFREVGGAARDKDAEGFVDISEVSVENDCALLFCTDGLTDLVPSLNIAHLVSRHAGRPEEVVHALVAAANEAGGKDNVTVVYLEAPGFKSAMRRAAALPMLNAAVSPAQPGATRAGVETRAAPEPAGVSSAIAGFVEWSLARRTTWLALGVVIGIVAALAPFAGFLRVGSDLGRTLVVGGDSTFARIADATAVARSGDVIQLQPGTYMEQVVLPGGVELRASVEGKAILVAPAGNLRWVAITAGGNEGGRIHGLRLESSSKAPITTGVEVSSGDWWIDAMEFEGGMRTAIGVGRDATAVIRAAWFRGLEGPAIALNGGREVAIANSVFIREAGVKHPAVSMDESSNVVFTSNVFSGYSGDVLAGVSADAARRFLTGNFEVTNVP